MYAGVIAAIAAAVLFGSGTPFAKLLLARTDPWMLAALLYLGSGAGLWLLRRIRRAPGVRLEPGEWRWLGGSIVAGGMVGPVLLMLGLSAMPASGTSLLLNAEAVLTAVLAWFVFKENFDRRIVIGMLAIIAGAVLLSWPQESNFAGIWPSLSVLGACFAWAVDNNLTRKVSLTDASYIAMMKGLVAGATNLVLAFLNGAAWPSVGTVASAGLLGFLCYGISLVLFVVGLRNLGTARTGAYFSVAPFFGAFLAIVLLGEPVTLQLIGAGLLMAFGVAVHLTEQHQHGHTHEAMAHAHDHVHAADGDVHHDHGHDEKVGPGVRHSHWHQHNPIAHVHHHFPDAHHRHTH
jgi:drug/metabolite transporter (DMT)-like permease